MNMRRAAAFIAALCLVLALCGCGQESAAQFTTTDYGKYKTLAVFDSQEFSIGFRNDDFVRYYVEAAIKVLCAEGSIRSAALQWFASDDTSFPSDPDALEKIGQLPSRELIVGADPDAFPMSSMDADGNWSGFDVDVVMAVCGKLGWTLRFIPIKAQNAYVELSSGNVDVAWGGLDLDRTSTKFTSLEPYMKNELVLVVLSSSGIHGRGGLKGKAIAIDVDQQYMDALDTDQTLKAGFAQITRVTGGAQKCFEELDGGKADAIIVYSAAARYYGR